MRFAFRLFLARVLGRVLLGEPWAWYARHAGRELARADAAFRHVGVFSADGARRIGVACVDAAGHLERAGHLEAEARDWLGRAA